MAAQVGRDDVPLVAQPLRDPVCGPLYVALMSRIGAHRRNSHELRQITQVGVVVISQHLQYGIHLGVSAGSRHAPTANRGSLSLIASEVTMKSTLPSAGLMAC